MANNNNIQNQNTSESSKIIIKSTVQSSSNEQINMVGQGAKLYPFNAPDYDIQYPLNLKFRNYPFCHVVHEIIKPTILANNEEPIAFNLSPNDLKYFRYCPKVVKRAYAFQFQIRIGKIGDDVSSLITDYLPSGFKIKFESSPCELPYYCTLPPPIEATQPIICTNLLTLNSTVKNMIFVKWTPDQENYALTLNIVTKLTVNNLMEQLQDKSYTGSNKNLEKTKKIIIKMMADSDLLLATGISANVFCLFCPLGKTRMKIPVKSIHCDHLQCFDAKIFLQMNERKPTWKCPICDIPCFYDDLEIQYYFLEVLLSEILSDCRYIMYKSDGTWTQYYEENEMEEEPINLDEDEDEDEDGDEDYIIIEVE